MLAFSTASQGIPPSEVAAEGEPVTIPVTMLVASLLRDAMERVKRG